jgi:hypothetical protein
LNQIIVTNNDVPKKSCKTAEPEAKLTCLISVEGVFRVLDDLIRAALQEAAAECIVPDAVEQLVWSRIIWGGEPGAGGQPDG